MKKTKVYVADDNVHILELLRSRLEIVGCKVITSLDSLSLAILEELHDMVFLDIVMRETNGADICREYKANQKTANVPVVLISADINLKKKASNCGADGMLAKPFDIREVAVIARKYTKSG